jgi:hypothetical protein
MSAQQVFLEDWLQRGVVAGAVSLAEAWALQDLASLLPPGAEAELPKFLEPVIDRLFLLEVPPANKLPA